MASAQDVAKLISIAQSLGPVIDFIKKLFHKEPVPVPRPAIKPSGDDEIQRPGPGTSTGAVRLVRVDYKLQQAQYNRKRVDSGNAADFENAYTDQNPQGLYSASYLQEIAAGKSALMWGSKFWLDATAYIQDGDQVRPTFKEDNYKLGYAFNTEHHIVLPNGETFIIGKGADADGQPNPGYETKDTDPIGQGISAWLDSVGFRQQFKAFDKCEFTAYCIVNGVKSNEIKIKVS